METLKERIDKIKANMAGSNEKLIEFYTTADMDEFANDILSQFKVILGNEWAEIKPFERSLMTLSYITWLLLQSSSKEKLDSNDIATKSQTHALLSLKILEKINAER